MAAHQVSPVPDSENFGRTSRMGTLNKGSVIVIGGEYDLTNQTMKDLNVVMFVEDEIRSGLSGGDVIKVNGEEYILWGRTLDRKNRTVKYNLMPKGE